MVVVVLVVTVAFGDDCDTCIEDVHTGFGTESNEIALNVDRFTGRRGSGWEMDCCAVASL